MKKYPILFLLGGILAICACNEDDDPKFENVNRLAGEWKLTKVGGLGDTNNLNYTSVSESCASTLVFSDSTFVENNAMMVGENCQTESRNGAYGIEQGNLVRSYSDASESTDDILRLTNTELELIHNDAETSELIFLVYTRQ